MRDTMHRLFVESTRQTEQAVHHAKEARSRIINFEVEHCNDASYIRKIPKQEKLIQNLFEQMADLRLKINHQDSSMTDLH